VFDEDNLSDTSQKSSYKRKPQKKITLQRLKNIALYYLKRYESSVENLRGVLMRRVDAYSRENPQWNKAESYQWIEEILENFERLDYLDDNRFTQIKVRSYLNAGKSARYIQEKLRQKGIDAAAIEAVLQEQDYNPLQMALKLAKRKKIGPYREQNLRREYRQKDMGTLIRAGFDYDVVCEVLNMDKAEEK